VVSVLDTGIGIAPELLPRIFDTFTQADHTLDRSRGGLGLGLALVKGLVELHGGAVAAASEGPGRGATFTFTLPLATAALTPPAPAVVSAAPGPRRILVIEDHPDAAATLRDILELLGHTVEVALSGPEGVTTAARFGPEIVLCDLGLPEMDGYHVAAELRRNPRTAAARLVAVSGYGEPEDRRRAREAGFDEHLTKPVETEELMAVLQT
jgi:CheY-like chemotaxis protein